MPKHIISLFLKFGEERHMCDLFYNGTIYMNPIQYFRNLEDNHLRGDTYEGISRIKNYPPGKFTIPSLGFTGNYLAFQVRESYQTVLGNIFSLYCVSSHGWKDPSKIKISDLNKRFGSHCVIIKNNVKFLSLIENKLKEIGADFHHGFVKYYDKDKIDRKLNLFEKPLEFEYQKEFRFYVDTRSDEPFIINIGSLEDIAELHPAGGIIDTLEAKIKGLKRDIV